MQIQIADHPVIKNFPPGWKILKHKMCHCAREAIVLCEKSDDRVYDTQYVTWEADLVHGGCYHGHYTEDLAEAEQDLIDRRV